MMRRLSVAAWIVVGLISAPARAQEGAERVLKVVPAEAVAILAAPHLGQLDQDFQQTANALDLGMMLQPPFNSIVAILQQVSGVPGGISDQGPAAIVVMPITNPFEISMKSALMLPTADPQKMLEGLGAQAGEGGMWTATVRGMPMTAATSATHVVLAMNPETAKAVAHPSTTIDSRMSADDKAALAEADLFLWLDAEKLGPMIKPQMEGFFAMAAMGAGTDPATKAQMDSSKQEFNKFLDESRSAMLAIRLKPEGLGLRFGFAAKPGSELAGQLKPIPVTGSLLRGLPAGPYMFVTGGAADVERVKAQIDELDPMFMALDQIPEVVPEQASAVKSAAKQLIAAISFGAAKVEALPVGENGVIGAGIYLETTNSGKFITDLTALVAAIKALTPNAEIKQGLDAIIHTPDAEKIAGAGVHHLKFDVAKLEDAEEEDIEEMTTVLGKDGLAVRFAAVDDRNVAFAFGGGSAYLEAFMNQIKEGSAPLDADAGITKVAGQIPEHPYTVGYVAVDQIIECVKNGAKALGDEELPIDMPALNAPAAVSINMADAWSQLDVFMPMELIVAGKNAIMAMTMYNPPDDAEAALEADDADAAKAENEVEPAEAKDDDGNEADDAAADDANDE